MLEEIAGAAQPSSTLASAAASSAGDDRVSAFFEGTGPQPTEGGPQKRKASPSQPGLPPPGSRASGSPLQQPAGSAQGVVAKGSQLGPGQRGPATGRHHAFPGPRP
eukprot:8829436-Alexandrium_andersonii.AAC.1